MKLHSGMYDKVWNLRQHFSASFIKLLLPIIIIMIIIIKWPHNIASICLGMLAPHCLKPELKAENPEASFGELGKLTGAK